MSNLPISATRKNWEHGSALKVDKGTVAKPQNDTHVSFIWFAMVWWLALPYNLPYIYIIYIYTSWTFRAPFTIGQRETCFWASQFMATDPLTDHPPFFPIFPCCFWWGSSWSLLVRLGDIQYIYIYLFIYPHFFRTAFLGSFHSHF